MALSQIIVTSRYLKSGTQKSKNKRRNYTKYIATRETVEVREQNTVNRNDNATKNQKELIDDLLVLSISLDTFYSNKNYATRKI